MSAKITYNGSEVVSVEEGQAVKINCEDRKMEHPLYIENIPTAKLVVTAPTGSTVTCVKGSVTLTAPEVSGTWTFSITDFGVWTVNASKGSEHASEDVEIADAERYSVSLAYSRIYGASWDGSSSPSWTRTDAAQNFTDPVPYVAGASNYGSPFDNLMPWSGMVRVTDSAAGELVKIPKFWYKLTQSGAGIKVQIADAAAEGFSVSPAHMNRGDGKGERDFVYIGRYHCASDYKSKTGVKPQASKTRSEFRNSIKALGTGISQADFAMRFTIWLLYIVEFADWNSQETIGYGCGNGNATENMGYTDGMPYHTGTTKSSRDTEGCCTQYRYIEGLWDNVLDWCDGCYYNNNGLNIILNPANFSDTSGGTLVGRPSDGFPSAFTVNSNAGFPMFYPTEADGSETTYSCDGWSFYSSFPCLVVGGYCSPVGYFGLFFVYCDAATVAGGNVGSRLQKLP